MNLNPPGGIPPHNGAPHNGPPLAPSGPPASNPASAGPAALSQGAGNHGSRRRSGSPLIDARRHGAMSLRQLDQRDTDGLSALHRAILSDNCSEVVRLLRSGANPNLRLPDQTTPLMVALHSDNAELVQALLGTPGVELDARDGNGATALHHAAKVGLVGMIDVLVTAGADPLLVRSNGFNALHIAAYFGQASAVGVLMDAMPGQWDQCDNGGNTPLLYAATKGHADVVASMVARPGFDVNQRARSGHTALHVAAEKGYADVVAALVEAPGIDVNLMRNGLGAALHLVVAHNHLDVLATLLDTPGLDVNLCDRNGVTALVWCSPQTADVNARVDAALMLLSHPDADPNGALMLLSTSPRIMEYFRKKSGAPASLSNRDFEIQELERWTQWMPPDGRPNRWLSSMTNCRLGVLLHHTPPVPSRPPVGKQRDADLRDGAFRMALALEQSLDVANEHNQVARTFARKLLEMTATPPTREAAQPNPYYNQFLIGGIAIARSEIEDMAHMRGNYALQGEIHHIVRHGWHANVHQSGFLLRGRDILMRLQERHIAGLPLEEAVAAVRYSIDAVSIDATASGRLQAALQGIAPLQAQDGHALSDETKLAMASWIALRPEPERATLHSAWRVRLMHAGLHQTLSQNGAVNEGGLTTTAPETLRLLQSYIHWQSGQPGRQAIALQLQQAMLERLHDIGSEPRVCNTGCVQRLLDAPAGIDDTLMAREPHDRAIFDEILRIGSTVNQAFDDQFDEGDQGIVSESDQQNYDALSHIVRKDILRATTIDDLVRRRGWSRSKVEAQLDTVLDGL